jgi:hypothetical protein
VSFHARYDCLDMDLTAWLLFGIVALLIILAILALFAGSCPSDISIGRRVTFLSVIYRSRSLFGRYVKSGSGADHKPKS